MLAIAMGLRQGEIVGLRWSDVDLDGRVLREAMSHMDRLLRRRPGRE
ncbi:hypothetical protein ABZ920_23350 [Streptomyces sp. NPDC046831]